MNLEKKYKKLAMANKKFINTFKGPDRKRAERYVENKLTKKDRLIFSNNLVKCKFILRAFYKRLDEVHAIGKSVNKSQSDAFIILRNCEEDKKYLLSQIDRYRNFLISFVFKGIDKYFTKEEICQLIGNKETLDKYYMDNGKSKGNFNFTYEYITKYKCEFISCKKTVSPLYRCLKEVR